MVVLGGMLMVIALPLLVSQAQSAYNVSSPPSFSFVPDEQGPDDVPGQKDLNAHAVATPAPGELWFAIKWDDSAFSGSNTGDACALFDTDVDSNANYAVCAIVTGSPVTQVADSPHVWSCKDTSPTKCFQGVEIAKGETACGVGANAPETFPTAHPDPARDTLAYCRVDTSIITGTPNLANTCSYTSSAPTSNTQDCVLVPRDAFIRVKKITNVATTDTFDFSLTPAGGTTATPAAFDNLAGGVSPGTTSAYVGIRSDKAYSLAEVVPSGWGVTGTPTCANTSGTADSLGSSSAGSATISGIDAKSDGQITCTYNDSLLSGGLTVHKYIDIDENGTEDPNETTLGLNAAVLAADVTGWSFTVKQGSTTLCTGTTGSGGVLGTCLKPDGVTPFDLSSLSPGTYAVTENANSGRTIGDSPGAAFFNTDPGTAPAAAPVSDTNVAVSANSTTNVSFGNTCYNTATFQVTGVPSGQSGLFVRYWTTDATTKTSVTMTKQADNTTWKGSAGSFRKGDVVHWEFGLSSNTSTTVAGTDVTLPGYPACGASQSASFGSATISGVKYKDLNNDGTMDTGEGGLAGITIQLKQGTTVVDSKKTGANGAFSFSSVSPGSYTLHEVVPTGWQQTEPAAGADITVNVPLGASGTISTYGSPATAIQFGNTPLSTIDVKLNSLGKLYDATGAETGPATKATSIDCKHGTTDVGSSTNQNTNTTNNLTLDQSTVTCVITYAP